MEEKELNEVFRVVGDSKAEKIPNVKGGFWVN